MKNFEITKREVLFSIIIILVIIAVGFLISTKLHDTITERNTKYYKALKVDNNEETFKYAINTEVGSMLSSGVFQAETPVTDDLIKGKFFSIIKIEEHYVMKTRTESYKCGKSTCHRTVTYWEWEEHGREKFNTKKFSYLGKTFNFKEMEFDFHEHLDTVTVDSHKRFIFRVIPEKFKGTLYSYAVGKKISENEVFYQQSIKEVVKDKEKEADNSTILFWVIWIFVSGIGIFLFVYAENEWLNKK